MRNVQMILNRLSLKAPKQQLAFLWPKRNMWKLLCHNSFPFSCPLPSLPSPYIIMQSGKDISTCHPLNGASLAFEKRAESRWKVQAMIRCVPNLWKGFWQTLEYEQRNVVVASVEYLHQSSTQSSWRPLKQETKYETIQKNFFLMS